MNEPLPNEWLSAWIDGELTAEQRASVEAHLAGHPNDSQLLEELKRLQTQLRGLPRYKAPAGMQDAVLENIRAAESESVSLPPTSWARTAQRNAWLVTCAASLIGLILVGIFYRTNQDPLGPVAMEPSPKQGLARTEMATTERSAAIDLMTEGDAASAGDSNAAQTEPRAQASKDVEPTDRDQPALSEKERSIAENAPARPESGVDDAALAISSDPAPADSESERVDASQPALAMQAKAGGGGFGGELQDRSEMKLDNAVADAQPAPAPPQAPAEMAKGALESNATPDSRTGFDQLIIVRVPAGYTGEEWMALVFAQASVQVDAEQPADFDGKLRQRDEQRAGANLRGGEAPLVAGNAPAGNRLGAETKPDIDWVKDKLGNLQSPTLFYGTAVEAYMIDAHQDQIRQILDRLEGSVVVGLSNQFFAQPVAPPQSETRSESLAYPASPAVARRLAPQLLRSEADPSIPLEDGGRDLRKSEALDESRSDTAEAMKQLPEGSEIRQRYLIVVLGPNAADGSAAPESAPPAKK